MNEYFFTEVTVLTDGTKKIARKKIIKYRYNFVGFSIWSVISELEKIYNEERAEDKPDMSALLARINGYSIRCNRKAPNGILVLGESGFLTRRAKCCNPLPGDEISGYITCGRGVSVHRAQCPNVLSGTLDAARMIEVCWDTTSGEFYNAEFEIVCADRSELLARLIAQPAAVELKLQYVCMTPNKIDPVSTLKLGVTVNDYAQIIRLTNKLRTLKNVYSVTRSMSMQAG